MTNKWNEAEIKNTSQGFAEVVCEEYFKSKENINVNFFLFFLNLTFNTQ